MEPLETSLSDPPSLDDLPPELYLNIVTQLAAPGYELLRECAMSNADNFARDMYSPSKAWRIVFLGHHDSLRNDVSRVANVSKAWRDAVASWGVRNVDAEQPVPLQLVGSCQYR